MEVDLTNAGTITGNVTANPEQNTGFFSTIDSTGGTINGDVSLGGGNDVVVARYNGAPDLVTGISGRINAGDGTNVIELRPADDLSISTAVSLPDTFQRLRLAPEADATITLEAGFVAPGTIELAGAGSIDNRAAIATDGQAFVLPYYVSDTPANLINDNSIEARVSGALYALDLGILSTFTNNGAISSSADGVTQTGDVHQHRCNHCPRHRRFAVRYEVRQQGSDLVKKGNGSHVERQRR